MNKRIEHLLLRFSNESYYIQKKARYTLGILVFVTIYAYLMFLTDILLYHNYVMILMEFIGFSLAMLIVFQLWLHKHIELATNITAMLGFGFAILLFFEPVSLRFYMQLLMAMLIIAAGYVKVYQFVTTVTAFVLLLLLQSIYYALDFASETQVAMDWNAYLLSIMGISVLIICLLFLKSISEKELVIASKINDLMEKDELTDLPNRRKFTRLIETIIGETEMVFLMIDIDHFKRINDEEGHTKGDQVLIEFAKRINEMTRPTDYVFRWGGEEFVMMLTGEAEQPSGKIAERVRKGIESFDFGVNLKVTISIGLVVIPKDATSESVKDYIQKADMALYQAKENGRNQIIIHQETRH